MKKKDYIYCHFSFRRLRKYNGKYGIFAVAFYFDAECKKKILHKTDKIRLWQDQQFVTSIQSYAYALDWISKLQGSMLEGGVKQVYLVTDNSTLAGWIENHRKNKDYTSYMERAEEPYRFGGPREIKIGVGLAEVANFSRAYKYALEKYLPEDKETVTKTSRGNSLNIDVSNSVSVYDMLDKEPVYDVVVNGIETC